MVAASLNEIFVAIGTSEGTRPAKAAPTPLGGSVRALPG
jgi:hypothetical protein